MLLQQDDVDAAGEHVRKLPGHAAQPCLQRDIRLCEGARNATEDGESLGSRRRISAALLLGFQKSQPKNGLARIARHEK